MKRVGMLTRKGAQAYATVGLETAVMGASPHQLIVLLYDGLEKALNRALWALDEGKVAERGMAISKAITILDNGLDAALDMEKGGELSENLHNLYGYMSRTLLKANIKVDRNSIEHVADMVNDIATAWRSIGDNGKGLS
ncbi:flagellin-specific chaperone FliS [Zymobacter palmae]|uniref:Flagellar secretion chaperone FliS n=2 Tax=Zymobacter palmae TaxID=33074 RepID=A0A348HFL4_9GAMM|nr:flagellin-specific chaperone FliS [Zymobacter palmae]